MLDVFIGTLKDNIEHEVCLWEPKSLENAFRVARNVESKNMAMDTRRTNPNIYIDCEEEEEEEEPYQDENVEAISFEELTPTISCNALAGISTPQTLKIEGYKKEKGNSPN